MIKKSLDTPIRYLKGIGPKRAKKLAQLGIQTIEDVLYFFPRRYEDRSKFSPISQLKEHQCQTIKAKILVKGQRQSWRKRGFNILEVAVGDDTGRIFCVWFNQGYLANYFKVGQTLILHARVERYENRLQLNSPEFEIVSEEEKELLNLGRIVPVYGLTEGLTQRYFRQIVKKTIDEYVPYLNDFLPYDIRSRNNLLNLAKSLINIHFPQELDTQKEAYRRLSFEEFLLFQILLSLRKLKKKQKKGIIHNTQGKLSEEFIERLPFELTPSQKKVIEEIRQDMARPLCMQRLLQGDVGSGKTVVAAVCALTAIQGGYQAALLVPTEILAKQHYEKIGSQVSGFKFEDKDINIGLVTSGQSDKEKKKVCQDIKEGKVNLIVGTHALLEEGVQFKNLGLVVIDEQHKFGVGQRVLLPQKGTNPDVLIMTATPIPRTLAITIYGDLDISVIKELPAGRKPINTQWVNNSQRGALYDFIKESASNGHQVYVVYPVIEESSVMDLLSAKKMYAEFKNNLFKEFSVGLIHGKLSSLAQNKVMSQFQAGKIQILIATTVLEVGIDVPGATVMVIEHAERFGLSQLHQLRGRIGRGTEESHCILVSDTDSVDARLRLSAMIKYADGFRIAEEDLKIRGPGEFFGDRQHGLSELKIANPLTQMQLLKKARDEAVKLINLDSRLGLRQNALLKEKLLQRFPGYEKLMTVG